MLNLELFVTGLVRLTTRDEYADGVKKNLTIVFLAVGICVAIIQGICAINLYNGAQTENSQKCRKWLMATVVTAIVYVICVVTRMALDTFSVTDTTIVAVFTVYKVFEIAVVHRFVVTTTTTQSEYVSPYIIANDLPPSYGELQNQPGGVEEAPPFYEEAISPKENDNIV
ncbi:unnamed protein product [Orchesella dallaii]